MTTPPLKPPAADPRNAPRPGAALRAVLCGLAVDIGGSLMCSVVLTLFYVAQMRGQGVSEAQIDQAMENVPQGSLLALTGNLLGLAMSLLGGYVCARIARRDEYRVGLVMAAVSAAFGLATAGSADALDMTLLFTVTGLACNMLGVKYGADYNRRAETAADPAGDAPSP